MGRGVSGAALGLRCMLSSARGGPCCVAQREASRWAHARMLRPRTLTLPAPQHQACCTACRWPLPAGDAIAVDSHCFGCTAGAGSGCQGSTS